VDRVLIALLSLTAGFLLGLFGPGLFAPAQQAQQAEQEFLNPATETPIPLVIPRAVAQPTVVVPTLQPPTTPTQTPTPLVVPTQETAHTFVVKLKGGGEMNVVANDYAAALNNVRSQGGTPLDSAP
jgi:hypothetical protein